MTCKLCRIIPAVLCAVVLLLAGAAAAAEVMLGDADTSGEINIIDVTCIQRYLADTDVTKDFSETAADVDKSGSVEITDATFIQRYLAGIDTPYPIGALPTEPPTQAPTQMPTDEEGWGTIIFRP